MSRFLDLDRWPRRAQFDFFRAYERPHFGLTAEVDVTALRAGCRAAGASFALACWYVIYRVVNQIEAFRYRLRGARVWVHDEVRIGTTVDTGPESFGFAYLPGADDFPGFAGGARAAIEAARARGPGPMDDRVDDDALIHGTVLPWVRFTAIQHARRADPSDSAPKVSIGRAELDARDGRVRMPLGVEAHHALLDGVHLGRFYAGVQALLDDPRWLDPTQETR